MSIKNIKELENIVNSQLANKINKSTIENNELMIEINLENLEDVIQYLKSDDTCRFRQLIDIVGIDFPQEEKRFKLIYLLLSHENNLRIKVSISFEVEKKIPSITINPLTKFPFTFNPFWAVMIPETFKPVVIPLT